MGDEPAVGANYWSATLPQKTRLIFREKPFVFPAGEAIVLGLYTVWLSLTHSETLQLKAAFPRGSTRLVKLLLLVSENRHFSSSKAHFHVLPQSWNIKRRCFLQHTNQPAKLFRPICWVCLCFFSLSRLFKHKISVSCRVCDDVLFFSWTFCTKFGSMCLFTSSHGLAHMRQLLGRETRRLKWCQILWSQFIPSLNANTEHLKAKIHAGEKVQLSETKWEQHNSTLSLSGKH